MKSYEFKITITYSGNLQSESEKEAISKLSKDNSKDLNFTDTDRKITVNRVLTGKEKLEKQLYPGKIPEGTSKEAFIEFAVKNFSEFEVADALDLTELAIRGSRQSLYTAEQFGKILKHALKSGFKPEEIRQDIYNEYLR